MVDDLRILSLVKKSPFTTSSQVKNTPGSCRSLQSREDFTKANTEGANKARLDFAQKNKHIKQPDHFYKSILWTDKIMINLYQNEGKKKV